LQYGGKSGLRQTMARRSRDLDKEPSAASVHVRRWLGGFHGMSLTMPRRPKEQIAAELVEAQRSAEIVGAKCCDLREELRAICLEQRHSFTVRLECGAHVDVEFRPAGRPHINICFP